MNSIRTLDQFNFHHVLEETPGIAIVVFTGPHCGSCQQMKTALQTLLDEGQALTVYEVDAERDMALVREFAVFHLPGLFLYRDGQYHAPLEVVPLPGSIREGIDKLLARPAVEAP